ncbi:hypothetical protein EC843_101999 [Buttiauxella sp. JUb87]|uniref:hypothetical protein n=1 Tax=Buttiauxella sp. JUb87 TaxID=2485129 RepID=UPI00105C136B|nr:hypothetical protein [Buttiauxella sp. JUb87]TDN54940.1 hypothetical protein EC843_101999 [Buttiauxella sp. JUb87]
MEQANPRKSTTIAFIGRHLLSAAHQALSNTRQSVVAKLLNVADSTVLRRTEKYPEIMETLAASGVEDFVMSGERKMPLEHYRHLIWIQLEYSRLQLEMTKEKPQESCNSFAA